MNDFDKDVIERVEQNGGNMELKRIASEFMLASTDPKYSYNFSWQGRPIIQYPQDIVALQELIFLIKPDLIVETGIAHGGSLIFSASMLALLDMYESLEKGCAHDPRTSRRRVLGIDIDIRMHNKLAIERHPLNCMIEMIEGSSIAPDTIAAVHTYAQKYERILVCLDSNHTHEHVLAELVAYAPLTTSGSYCVVFDTIVEDLPSGMYPNRSWGPGNNPKTAVWEYLKDHPEFSIDHAIDNKLLISVAPNGFLKRA